jgi:hypothetical protein
LFVGHRLFLQKKDIWFHPNRIDFLVAHFHPATVVHFAPAKVVQFNPARVVYYDRFLQVDEPVKVNHVRRMKVSIAN